MIMATYYMRYTDRDACVGCGACVSSCPVDALKMEGEHPNEYPVVDEEWCIGCGVCVAQCARSAAKLRLRTDKKPPRDFNELYDTVLKEKGLK